MGKIFFCLILLCFIKPSHGDNSLNIAVASNFNSTFEKISLQYEKKEKIKINIISGSSGILFAQIVNGAPYDIFFSADRDRPKMLDLRGLSRARGTYAYGRVVFWERVAPAQEQSLSQSNRKLALARPEFAPYGKAALEILENFNHDLSNLAYGVNVNQVFAYIETGSINAGFISLSQALNKNISPINYLVISESLHSKIEQQFVITSNAKDWSEEFIDWVLSPAAQEIIINSGYRGIRIDDRK